MAILSVMIFSAVLPTMSAHAQTGSGNNDAGTFLQQCIEQFQGSDHFFCDKFYTNDIARSGSLNQYFRQGTLASSIVVYEHTKVTLSGLKSTDPDSGQTLSYALE